MFGAWWLSLKLSFQCWELRKVRQSRIVPHTVIWLEQGTVVNQASMAGIQGFNRPYMSVYSSSKAAVYSLSDAMRVEFAPFDVKVGYVCIQSYISSMNLYAYTVYLGGHTGHWIRKDGILQTHARSQNSQLAC